MLRKKQKLLNRILSSILALISVISLLPLQAYSADQEQLEEQVVSVDADLVVDDSVVLTLDGETVSYLTLQPYEKQVIHANWTAEDVSYQWQILHPKKDNLWINIYDATEASLPVTMALVGNMLTDNNTAQLRCRVGAEDTQEYSAALTVVLGEENPVPVAKESAEEFGQTQLESVGSEVLEPETTATLDSVQQTRTFVMSRAAEEETEPEETVPEFVTVTIKYRRYDYIPADNGKDMVLTEISDAFTPYVAALKSGSDLHTTVSCPTIVGYDAYLTTVVDGNETDVKCSQVDINLTNIQSNVVYTVKYKPAEVDYEVRYFFQNIYDDQYTEDATLVKNILGQNYPVKAKGETGTDPDIAYTHAEFSGFTSLYYEPEKIAADGSTVFHVYYERDYCLMEFDCNAGYGTDSIYVRYGTYVSVPNPTRSGYVFAGWNPGVLRVDGEGNPIKDNEGRIIIDYQLSIDNMDNFVGEVLPATMPAVNTYYRAEWKKADTTYSVVYWVEDGNGGKTYLGATEVEAQSDSIVTEVADIDEILICNSQEHTHEDVCYACTIPEHTHHEAHTQDCLNYVTEWTGVDGYEDRQVIAAADEESPSEEGKAYIYLIYTATNSALWPKIKIGDNFYTVKINGSQTVDEATVNAITVGDELTEGVYDSYRARKYELKGSCGLNVCEDDCTLEEHTHSLSCYSCGKNVHTHDATCKFGDGEYVESKRFDTGVRVEGDGSSVVNVYYQYKEYTLKFYYAASEETTGTDDTATTNYYIVGGSTYYFGHSSGVGGTDDFVQLNNMFSKLNQIGCTAAGTVPSLNEEGQRRLDEGIYEKKEELDEETGRTYYSISFKARYKDNISDKWPIDVFESVEMAEGQYNPNAKSNFATVSAWNGEYYVKYSQANSNETIKGKYEQLDDQLLFVDDYYNQTLGQNEDPNQVSFLCFWENGAPLTADNRWNIPKLFRYNIWIEALSSDVQKDENNEILYDDAGNPVPMVAGTVLKVYNGTIYTRVDVYNTCDNSDTSQQTQPALIGYTAVAREKTDMVGVSEVTDEDAQYDSDIYNYGENVHFYYTRGTHSLKFWNYNDWLGEGKGAGNEQEGGGVKYGTPLSIFGGYVTDAFMAQPENYPDGLEPDAYEFKGWYVSPGCYQGTEVVWTDGMPDADLTLYAKWEPVVHNVYFYYNYENYKSALSASEENKADFYWYYNDETTQPQYPIEVEHNKLLGTAYNKMPEPPKQGYSFVGWFYIDKENKKRFAPDTMEVKNELHLFAEWKSGIDTQYTVSYVLDKDGTVIATPTTGHLTAGKTKTFIAKVDMELNADYQGKPLFPLTNSHSILMDEDSTKNTYEFRYVEDDVVYYRVRYLDKLTNLPLRDDKVESSNMAIVTEKYVPVTGYFPSEYYVRKVLASDGDATEPTEQNEIIFYYTQDTAHGPFVIEYYTPVLGATDNQLYDTSGNPIVTYENGLANPYWHLEQSELGMQDLGAEITKEIDKEKFNGFAYSKATITAYGDDGKPKVEVKGESETSVSGKVTLNGLEIRIFYTRNSYDYVIKFVEYGTSNILGYGSLDAGETVYDDPRDDKKPFETVITYTAPDLIEKTAQDETTKYIFYSTDEKPQTQSWTIRDSNTVTVDGVVTEETDNVLIFYYQMQTVDIFYKAVCSEANAVGFGIVNLNYEEAASADTLSGSNALAGDGFSFKGWFTDEACTKPVDEKWRFMPGTPDTQDGNGTKLKPGKLPDADMVTYYALFEPATENILIKKVIDTSGTDSVSDTFLFSVTGVDVLGNLVDMVVSIQGQGSVTIKELYCGSYTVTELNNWSWTYEAASSQSVTLTTQDEDSDGNLLNAQITTYVVTFTNSPKTNIDWLYGESVAAENQFTIATVS